MDQTKVRTFNELKINRDRLSARLFEALSLEKPAVGAQAKSTLRVALRLGGRTDLLETTLLSRDIHKLHASYVDSQLTRMAKKSAGRGQLSLDERERLIRSRIRFVTVLYAAELLDESTVFDQCLVFKQVLNTALKLGCKESLGAVEVEVVNTEFAEDQLLALKTDLATVDKLETLEQLTPVWAKGSSRLALIHYHGVVRLSFPDDKGVSLLRDTLAKAGLSRVNRQIEISALTSVFQQRRKSLAENLSHIARYITKGGNKLVSGRIAFEYKSSFKQSDLSREKELILGHRNPESDSHREKLEEGLENPLGMSYQEVLFQAVVVDRLMDTSRNRRGYLLQT